ncbi:hypothetical protein F2Q69_00004411 [Brassica cretica]|uniref:Uncharacterized protein n=1 Tax=Brassica cretica TaxID=69181 RepID=A0A8S9PFY9_BRACR|nr:hypothetical protein F2Q69_00004411 [Brassica cretica]
MIFGNKKQFASNGFDFVQKQRNQRKRQNKFDDDEKWVKSGDRPFTKAKRSNCDVFDQNELQTYVSLEKMLYKAIHAIRQLKKKGNTNTSPSPKQQIPEVPFAFSDHIQHPAKVILPDLGRIKWMFGLLKKSKPQQDVYFPFKTVLEKEQMIFGNKKQFASNGFDFVQKQRKQRKRQNRFDDDEKWVRSGDRPFTKAKRSNCDMFDQNELQTYVSLEKMLHKAIHAIRQLKKKGNTNTSPAPKQQRRVR